MSAKCQRNNPPVRLTTFCQPNTALCVRVCMQLVQYGPGAIIRELPFLGIKVSVNGQTKHFYINQMLP